VTSLFEVGVQRLTPMMLAAASECPGKLPRGNYEQTELGEKHN